MIKLDGCNSCTDLFPEGHKAFKFYMNQTQREMFYSCEWPTYISEKKPKVSVLMFNQNQYRLLRGKSLVCKNPVGKITE